MLRAASPATTGNRSSVRDDEDISGRMMYDLFKRRKAYKISAVARESKLS